jgi:hypothetical protein
MLNRNSKIHVMTGLILAISITAHANWSETFGGNAFDLTTWKFYCYPDVTKTFKATIQDGAANNDYLSISETTSVGAMPPGSAFGMGFGSDEVFRDVRVGAVFNVTGDASRNYHGLAARASYFIDPDGSLTGAPGIVASAYIMIIHYEDSPANLRIELLKIVNLDDQIMQTYQPEVPVPGLDHARSHYVELDVVGSDPVYLTGSIYQYKGGPLLVRTPTFIDTSGNDPWEGKGIHDNVFASGRSGIFSSNQDPEPVGYHCTFDDVFSISDGPAAVNPSPADGATGVSIEADLSWVEAAFATSRQLWCGKQDAMQKVAPAPAGKSYDPGPLEFGQTYQWRVDEVGPSSTVTGHTWTFTTGQCLTVDDFESYADDTAIQSKWVHNIAGGYKYVFVDTGTVNQGAKSMRFEFQNQYAPYLTEATNTFAAAQDWTRYGAKALSLAFRGVNANVAQPMFIRLEDAAGKTATVPHPYTYAVESEAWRQWDIALTEFSGVNLAAIKKITIGVGNGTNSGQVLEDRDSIYIDNIRLCPARCFNVDQIDLRADINGDCVIDLADFAAIADGWLNDGLSVVP